MKHLTDIIAEGYALCEKIAKQKNGDEMRIYNNNLSAIDFEAAYNCIINDARLIVKQMEHLTGKRSEL